MPKRMTVVFDDEDLYTALKVEAARTGRHAKDIVAEALHEWLATQEDKALKEARREWQQLGGMEAGEFFRQVMTDKEG